MLILVEAAERKMAFYGNVALTKQPGLQHHEVSKIRSGVKSLLFERSIEI